MASLTRGGCGDEANSQDGRANSRDHRQMYKKGVSPVTFEDRIKNAKQRQRDIRHKLLAKARSLMLMQRRNSDKVESSMHVETDNDAGRQKHGNGRDRARKKRRTRFAAQLVEPEWMIRLPNDIFFLDPFATNAQPDVEESEAGWYVIPRVEGRRCLVISSHGRTVSRDKNGMVIHHFLSRLPNGGEDGHRQSLAIHGNGNDFSIFDCIYNDDTQAYYVLDVMCWKGQSFYGCTASFRFYWAQSKFGEVGISQFQLDLSSRANLANSRRHDIAFTDDGGLKPMQMYLLPHYHASRESVDEIFIHGAPQHSISPAIDGMIFVAKSSFYEPGPLPNPLWLLWKSNTCSKYFRSAAESIAYDNKRYLTLDNVVLESNDSCTFMVTREGIPILSCSNIQYPQKSNQVDKEGRKKKHKQNTAITNWSMLRPKTLYKFKMSLDCSINANNGNNALFLRELMILSYNSDIDRINGNGVAKSNDMNSISRYTTSVLKGAASKRRIYPDSYTKVCFHMFPTEL
eukprot:g6883.t1